MINSLLGPVPAAPATDPNGFLVAGLLVLLTLGLCLLVLYGAAPLMLYFIHSRLGETNELLRSIATSLQTPTGPHDLQKPSVPPSSSPEVVVPTFRMLR
jgi:hypothetical protein